jgi:hypothetical protein
MSERNDDNRVVFPPSATMDMHLGSKYPGLYVRARDAPLRTSLCNAQLIH